MKFRFASVLLACLAFVGCTDATSTSRPDGSTLGRDASVDGDLAPNPFDPCNGFDDNGDGIVDGPGECPLIYPCTNAAFCTCATGWSRCSTQCVREFVASPFCSPCTYACPSGTLCRAPRCTDPEGRVPFICSGELVDLASNRVNCGACNRVCPEGSRCINAGCSCPGTGLTACGLECVSVLSNPRHCGACGVLCPAGSTCTLGRCVCPDGEQLCAGRCVNLLTDRANCGICSRTCPTNGRCGLGVCFCNEGATLCGSLCTNLRSDDNNCGVCNTRCTAGLSTCVDGTCRCSAANTTLCSGVCRDLSRDDANCGTCAMACPVGDRCIDGRCRPLQQWPPNGARLGTRRPEFRWNRGAAIVQLCSDRECTREVGRFPSALPRVTVTRDIPPGVYFWSNRSRG